MKKQNPYDEVSKYFKLPFPPHDFQESALYELLSAYCSLLRFKVGLGKTYTSTVAALHMSLGEDGINQIWVICPPILLDQWYAFLNTIEGIPDICLYRGTPEERAAMDLQESVILASYNIFRGKRDYKRFKKLAKENKLCIIADELSLKSLKSSTYRKMKEIVYRKMRLKITDKAFHYLIALNATPLSDPLHVYNWCSLFTPGVYPSLRIFRSLHVKKEDHWGNVTEWENEDIMHSNMEVFTVDTDKEIKLPPKTETVVPYTLSPDHMALYKRIKTAQLAGLPEDMQILALNSMFSTLQRVVVLPREFGLDIDSPVLEFIHGYIDQMQEDDGVLIYTRHKMVSKFLAEKIENANAIFGGVSKKKREEIFAELHAGVYNPLVGNLDSLGKGLNLQMLNHIIYVEIPFRDDGNEQSLGRVHRQGQTKPCFLNYTIAQGTVQERIFYRLLKNGEDINKILRTKKDVKNFLS